MCVRTCVGNVSRVGALLKLLQQLLEHLLAGGLLQLIGDERAKEDLDDEAISLKHAAVSRRPGRG